MGQAELQAIEQRVLFGANIDPAIDALLQQAAAAADDPERREKLLLQAHARDHDELAVYLARYKFYCYAGRTDEAEAVVDDALHKAARQGGFDADWGLLLADDFIEAPPDSPRRHYLYGLKAMAFIKLRQGLEAQALAILNHLQRLDPQDRVGGSVVCEMARHLVDEELP